MAQAGRQDPWPVTRGSPHPLLLGTARLGWFVRRRLTRCPQPRVMQGGRV